MEDYSNLGHKNGHKQQLHGNKKQMEWTRFGIKIYSWIHILVLKYAKIIQDQPLITYKGDGLRLLPLCLNTQTISPPWNY